MEVIEHDTEEILPPRRCHNPLSNAVEAARSLQLSAPRRGGRGEMKPSHVMRAHVSDDQRAIGLIGQGIRLLREGMNRCNIAVRGEGDVRWQ